MLVGWIPCSKSGTRGSWRKMTCIKFSLRMHRIDLGRSYNGKTFSTSRDNINLVCSNLTHLQSSVTENQFHSYTWLSSICVIRLQVPLMDSLRPDSPPQQKAPYPKLLCANNNQLYSHNEQQSFWNDPIITLGENPRVQRRTVRVHTLSWHLSSREHSKCGADHHWVGEFVVFEIGGEPNYI